MSEYIFETGYNDVISVDGNNVYIKISSHIDMALMDVYVEVKDGVPVVRGKKLAAVIEGIEFMHNGDDFYTVLQNVIKLHSRITRSEEDVDSILNLCENLYIPKYKLSGHDILDIALRKALYRLSKANDGDSMRVYCSNITRVFSVYSNDAMCYLFSIDEAAGSYRDNRRDDDNSMTLRSSSNFICTMNDQSMSMGFAFDVQSIRGYSIISKMNESLSTFGKTFRVPSIDTCSGHEAAELIAEYLQNAEYNAHIHPDDSLWFLPKSSEIIKVMINGSFYSLIIGPGHGKSSIRIDINVPNKHRLPNSVIDLPVEDLARANLSVLDNKLQEYKAASKEGGNDVG